MDSYKKIEEIIGFVLLIGVITSLLFVCIGGFLFLLQAGTENLGNELLQQGIHYITFNHIWQSLVTFSAIGWIELGLYLLVITQVLRVALLAGFYVFIRDYWFASASIFILLVLTYSLFFRSGVS